DILQTFLFDLCDLARHPALRFRVAVRLLLFYLYRSRLVPFLCPFLLPWLSSTVMRSYFRQHVHTVSSCLRLFLCVDSRRPSVRFLCVHVLHRYTLSRACLLMDNISAIYRRWANEVPVFTGFVALTYA